MEVSIVESTFEKLTNDDKTITIAEDTVVNQEPVEVQETETNEFFCHDHHAKVIEEAEKAQEVLEAEVVEDVELPDITKAMEDSIENIEKASFYTDDEKAILKGLQLKSTLAQIDRVRADIVAARESTIIKPDENDKVYQMVQEKDLDEIKAMSIDEIDAWYAEKGIDVEKDNINYTTAESPEEQKIYRKDILIFFRELYDAEVQFAEEEAIYNKEIAEISDEMNEAIAQFGSVSNFMEKKFKSMIEAAKDKTEPEVYEAMVEAFDNGLTLKVFQDYAASNRGKKILRDFKVNKESEYVYRKYLKASKSISLKTDLVRFVNVERTHLGIDNPLRDNIVVFTIIHWIAMMVPKMDKKELTLAQITANRFNLNMNRLFSDGFETPDEKEIFLDGMKKIVEIVG